MGCWNNCFVFSKWLQPPARAKTQLIPAQGHDLLKSMSLILNSDRCKSCCPGQACAQAVGSGYLAPSWSCSLPVTGTGCCAMQQLLEFLPGEVIPTDQAQQGNGAWIFPLCHHPVKTPNPCHGELCLWEPPLHCHQMNPISAPPRYKQVTAQSQDILAPEPGPQLPVHSACCLHPVCPAQRQHSLVPAACEPFSLHRSVADGRVERNSS